MGSEKSTNSFDTKKNSRLPNHLLSNFVANLLITFHYYYLKINFLDIFNVYNIFLDFCYIVKYWDWDGNFFLRKVPSAYILKRLR